MQIWYLRTLWFLGDFAPCDWIKTVLDSGFHMVDSGFQVLYSHLCQRKLASGFQSLDGFWIPWFVFRIPMPKILASTCKIFTANRLQIWLVDQSLISIKNFFDFHLYMRVKAYGSEYICYPNKQPYTFSKTPTIPDVSLFWVKMRE